MIVGSENYSTSSVRPPKKTIGKINLPKLEIAILDILQCADIGNKDQAQI